MKGAIKTISQNTKKAIVNKILNFTVNTSDKNLIRLTYLAEKIAHKKDKSKIASVRTILKKQHPATKLIRNVFTKYDRHCTNKLMENFIINNLIIDNGIREEEIKKGNTALFTLLISPTMRCNLKCTGCYASKYNKKDDLDFELLDRIIKEAKEMKTTFFTILGGEPFIRNDMFNLYEKHSDCYFQVYTNATLITESICQKLKEVGNVFPQISIEGFEKETDERRGKGTYKKIIKAIDLLNKHKIPFGYSVCVTSKNVETVFSDEFIDLIIKKGALVGWYFLYMPVCGNPDMKLMPSAKQRVYMLERGRYIRKNKPLFIIDFWNDAPYVGGCIAGKYYAHITSEGHVEPCIFTHFATDNIKEKPLKKCLDSDYFRALRKKQPFNDNLYLPCQWIDNPEVSREMYKRFNLKSTHPMAEDILVDEKLKRAIDNYSKSVKEEYKEIWYREYTSNKNERR